MPLNAVELETPSPLTPLITCIIDIVVPVEDIRRPLGIDYTDTPRRIAESVAYLVDDGPFGCKERLAGLDRTATDVDVSTGDGPLVRGLGGRTLGESALLIATTNEMRGAGVNLAGAVSARIATLEGVGP